jgi:phosphatidylserine decarboxylase
MGYFEFGGSTLVLVIPKGMLTLKQEFLDHSKQNCETEVKMGDVIGYLN